MMTFTAVFQEAEEGGYIAFVAELPVRTPKARPSTKRERTSARPFYSFLMRTVDWR
jgi:hypothetical protein